MRDIKMLALGDSYQNIAQSILLKCNHQFAVKTFSRGEVLLLQGQKQQYGYLILEGVLAALHTSAEGGQKCKEFYFQDEFALLYGNWLTDSQALYQIQVVKTAQLIAVPLTALEQPDWQQLKQQLISQQLVFKEAKEAFLLLNTPEQRYRYLLAQKPHWLAQLTLTEVAMYIGVSAISLSRIRQRLNLS